MKVAVAVNPSAGRGLRSLTYPEVAARLSAHGHEPLDLTGHSAADTRARLTAAVADGVDAVLVAGGDGMAHLGAGVCAGTATPLALVPTGTGNDFARSHSLSLEPGEALQLVLQRLADGTYRSTDVARVQCADGSTHWFLSVLSLGFDAVVSERANRLRWPSGPQRYTVAVARELPVFRPPAYRLLIDGEPLDTRAMLVSVANSRAFGGGMQIAPDASTEDGLLDLVLLAPVAIPEFVRFFPSVFRGTHVRNRHVSIRRCRRVEVEVDRPIVAYADGERLGPAGVRCEVVPGALRLVG